MTLIFVTDSPIGKYLACDSHNGSTAVTYIGEGYFVVKKPPHCQSDYKYFYTSIEAFLFFRGLMPSLRYLELDYYGKVIIDRERYDFFALLGEFYDGDFYDGYPRTPRPIKDILNL